MRVGGHLCSGVTGSLVESALAYEVDQEKAGGKKQLGKRSTATRSFRTPN